MRQEENQEKGCPEVGVKEVNPGSEFPMVANVTNRSGGLWWP